MRSITIEHNVLVYLTFLYHLTYCVMLSLHSCCPILVQLRLAEKLTLSTLNFIVNNNELAVISLFIK